MDLAPQDARPLVGPPGPDVGDMSKLRAALNCWSLKNDQRPDSANAPAIRKRLKRK